MTKKNATKEVENELPSQLYIAIDHLKDGMYQLNIMNNKAVVSTVKFKKMKI